MLISVHLLLYCFTTTSSDNSHTHHLTSEPIFFKNWIVFHQIIVEYLLCLWKIKDHRVCFDLCICLQIGCFEYCSWTQNCLIFMEKCWLDLVSVRIFLFYYDVDLSSEGWQLIIVLTVWNRPPKVYRISEAGGPFH